MFIQLPATTSELRIEEKISHPAPAWPGWVGSDKPRGRGRFARADWCKVYKRPPVQDVEGGGEILPGEPCVCRLRPLPMA